MSTLGAGKQVDYETYGNFGNKKPCATSPAYGCFIKDSGNPENKNLSERISELESSVKLSESALKSEDCNVTVLGDAIDANKEVLGGVCYTQGQADKLAAEGVSISLASLPELCATNLGEYCYEVGLPKTITNEVVKEVSALTHGWSARTDLSLGNSTIWDARAGYGLDVKVMEGLFVSADVEGGVGILSPFNQSNTTKTNETINLPGGVTKENSTSRFTSLDQSLLNAVGGLRLNVSYQFFEKTAIGVVVGLEKYVGSEAWKETLDKQVRTLFNGSLNDEVNFPQDKRNEKRANAINGVNVGLTVDSGPVNFTAGWHKVGKHNMLGVGVGGKLGGRIK